MPKKKEPSLKEIEANIKALLPLLPDPPRRPRVKPKVNERGDRVCAWCRNNLPLREVWRLGPDGVFHDQWVSPHPNRRYCSDRCRTQHNRWIPFAGNEGRCGTCGKALPKYQSRYSTAKGVRTNRKYCSVRCRVAAHRANAKRKGTK